MVPVSRNSYSSEFIRSFQYDTLLYRCRGCLRAVRVCVCTSDFLVEGTQLGTEAPLD